MKLFGIDVSHYQGTIDWNTVKSQIDYAILSVGYGDDYTYQDDRQFKRNADECTRLGIPFGVYIYSYATTVEQAKSEANHVLRLVKGYKLSLPVYYDLEDEATTGKCSNSQIADFAETFCNIIENNGYEVGIYANTYWFTNKLTDIRFSKYSKWVAQYASSCTYNGNYSMWQYASDGKINGITGNVDVNYYYQSINNEVAATTSNEYEEFGTGYVQVDVLNIRDKPSTSGNIVGTYTKGETFKYNYVIVNEGYTWVRYTSFSGYIRYVAVVNNNSGEIYANYY